MSLCLTIVLTTLTTPGLAEIDRGSECVKHDRNSSSLLQVQFKNHPIVKDPAREGSAQDFDLLQKSKSLKEFLIPPSALPYNFTKYNISVDTHLSQYGQSQWVDDVLQHRDGLFVVESGAWDGEEMSNSIFFETQRQSKCLLIEPNPVAQQTITRKRRKCHLMKGGLSTEATFPTTHELIMAGGVGGFVEDIHEDQEDLVKSAIASSQTIAGSRGEFNGSLVNVTCFPLHFLMSELGVPTVDYWSLDTEGSEPGILQNTDFDSIEVGVMTIERAPDTRQQIFEIMSQKRFVRINSIGYDDTYANPRYFEKRNIPFPENPCGSDCPL